MNKRRPEVRILIKILAIIGALVLLLLLAGYLFIRIQAPHLLEFSRGVAEIRVTASLDNLEDARFIIGMTGCENIVLEEKTRGFYISCLDGYIHYLCPDSSGILAICRSYRAGQAVMGLSLNEDGSLFAAVCNVPLNEWRTKGASLYRISSDLETMKRLSEDYPSMNGICLDRAGDLYFTSSNFRIFHPEGTIYRMLKKDDGFQSPEPYIRGAGLANGLFFDPMQDRIFFSNTMGGVYEFSSMENTLSSVYLKLRFMEACDDLCTDIGGNIWMTDPGHSTVKMYNPGTKHLVRFVIEGIGQTSSCRIRTEDGREMLYITELKKSQQPVSDVFDGRGVLVVPAQSLLKQLEPLLIN